MINSLPNLLTTGRFICGLLLALSLLFSSVPYSYSIVLLIIASVTTMIEGPLARHFGVRSHWGRILAPYATALCFYSPLILLMDTQVVPAWIIWLIIMRDLGLESLRRARPNFHFPLISHRLYLSSVTILLLAMMLHLSNPISIQLARLVEVIAPITVGLALWSGLMCLQNAFGENQSKA